MIEFIITPVYNDNRNYYTYNIKYRRVHLLQFLFRWKYRTDWDGNIKNFNDIYDCALEIETIKSEYR